LQILDGFTDIVNFKIVNTTEVYNWAMKKNTTNSTMRMLQDAPKSDLLSDLFFAGIALLIILGVIAIVLVCIKYCYRSLP
jgi:hypothetical protein